MFKGKILVVEDEPKWREMLKEELEEDGYVVFTAASDAEALKELRQAQSHSEAFDMVILDLTLVEEVGKMSGRRVLDYLRQSCSKTRCIVVSGSACPADVRDFFKKYNYVACDFFEKGRFELSDLKEAIARTLSPQESGRGEGGLRMLPPEQQAALMVLTEATKFLFSELGRQLTFWREKRKEKSTPTVVELIQSAQETRMKMGNVEQPIKLSVLQSHKEDIETSLKRLRRYKRQLNSLRVQESSSGLMPKEKEYIDSRIPELEDKVKEEGERLQQLLDLVYEQAR